MKRVYYSTHTQRPDISYGYCVNCTYVKETPAPSPLALQSPSKDTHVFRAKRNQDMDIKGVVEIKLHVM